MQEKRIYQIIKKNKKEISNYKEYLDLLLIYSYRENPSLLNPILVKLSIDEVTFNYYVKPILNITRDEYLDSITNIFKDEKNAIDYIYHTIDMIDYENEIDMKAASIYFDYIREKINLTKRELRFFSKYIIGKKAHELNVSARVLEVNYCEYNKYNKKKNREYILENDQSNSKWRGMCNYYGPNNFLIFINRLAYYEDLTEIGEERAFLNLIRTCYHELNHAYVNTNELQIVNRKNYRIWKENLLTAYNYKYYNDNHLFLEAELNADNESEMMLINDIDSNVLPEFSNYRKGIYNLIANRKKIRSTKRYYDVEDKIDTIFKNNYQEIDAFFPFSIEYNQAGNRNDLLTILTLKDDHIDSFEQKIVDLKYKYMVNSNMDENKKIKEVIIRNETIINGLKEVFNMLIFKALVNMTSDNFLSALNDHDLESITDAINAEIEYIEKQLVIYATPYMDARKSAALELLELVNRKNQKLYLKQ